MTKAAKSVEVNDEQSLESSVASGTPDVEVSPPAAGEQASGNSVETVRFTPLPEVSVATEQNSIDLLLDVELDLSVELGRTTIPVKEVLQLGSGSIVELEKSTGDPVDIMVNGKLIARGEVVVVDENFGVRVTEIASRTERLTRLA